jgi:nucleotide-binding universal stress UspA family protein
MRRILVPLDGSALAEAALPHAKELASRLSSSIHLLRVVPLARQLAASSFAGSGGIDGMPGLDVKAIDEAVEARLEEATVYIEEQGKKLRQEGVSVEWEIRQGTATEEILECAKNNDIELIAISTHGRSGLGRLVFGSVFDSVMRGAGIPVMVIKPPKAEASDGSADAAAQ